MKITAEIKNYKFVKDEELKRFWRMAIGMVDGDGLVRIEVSKAKRKQRTNSQNSYYWGVVIPHLQMILRDLGNDFKDEELHACLKQKFLDNRVMTVLGESIEVEPSTADPGTRRKNKSRMTVGKINHAAQSIGVRIGYSRRGRPDSDYAKEVEKRNLLMLAVYEFGRHKLGKGSNYRGEIRYQELSDLFCISESPLCAALRKARRVKASEPEKYIEIKKLLK